jgi:hypothetical protein
MNNSGIQTNTMQKGKLLCEFIEILFNNSTTNLDD